MGFKDKCFSELIGLRPNRMDSAFHRIHLETQLKSIPETELALPERELCICQGF